MALYSGVSPFEIPSFLGMDVDDVEETFERLVELEVVEEVRIRREVALNSRGRNIASEAMNEQ
jgi:helix-turn-helix protein